MSWWSKASTAQKLAQIDGGIECGLHGHVIALASGTTSNAVTAFAARHGRTLPWPTKTNSGSKARASQLMRDRAAFTRGDRISLWGNTEPQDDFLDERAEA